MEIRDVLADGFERVRGVVAAVAEGLSRDELAHRPGPQANSIAWLLWHLTRVQDGHVAEIAGREQAWVEEWAARFGMSPDPHDTGYGYTSEQVAAIRPDGPGILVAHHEAVHARTLGYLESADDADWERIIDRRWDPPVTVAVRLVSVLEDDLQHAGQAAYVRGLIRDR